MTLTEVKPILTSCLWADDALLMEGVHGIGKSAIVKEWCRENDIHMETLFLSTQDPGDLIGNPRSVERDGEIVSVWSKPEWLHKMDLAMMAGKRTCLFLDELNRAPLDVRQASLQLILEREIHQHKLPVTDGVRTIVVAATNPAELYQVDEMDPALLDRLCSVDVEPDLQVWLKYARQTDVPLVIQDFLVENPALLHFMPDEGADDTTSASPRSWSMLSNHVKNFNKLPAESHYSIIKGKVGTAVGSKFYQFMNTYSKQIKMEDVEKVANVAWEKTKKIEETAVFVKELIKDMESGQKQEMGQNFLHRYAIVEKQQDYKEVIPLLALLYALEIEEFMSIFKPLSVSTDEQDRIKFKALIDFDKDCNNKELLRRTLNVQNEDKN